MVRVKICGVLRAADAARCVEAGADAIGLNFWPRSPRRCALAEAARIVEAVGDAARLVAVVVDARDAELEAIRAAGVRWIQLHGDEPPAELARLGPEAYKAIHLASEAQLEAARAWPGDELLVDARLPGVPGGTGVRCDWGLAGRLAAERRVWLAGGLRPDNVADAIRAVRPYGVDVASGVERAPGEKDWGKVAAFVAAARAIPAER